MAGLYPFYLSSSEKNAADEANSFVLRVLPTFTVRLPPSMRLDELEYRLPSEQIAQRPLERREASRLLFLDRFSGAFEDRMFTEFPSLLRGDELLVLNNARVI